MIAVEQTKPDNRRHSLLSSIALVKKEFENRSDNLAAKLLNRNYHLHKFVNVMKEKQTSHHKKQDIEITKSMARGIQKYAYVPSYEKDRAPFAYKLGSDQVEELIDGNDRNIIRNY